MNVVLFKLQTPALRESRGLRDSGHSFSSTAGKLVKINKTKNCTIQLSFTCIPGGGKVQISRKFSTRTMAAAAVAMGGKAAAPAASCRPAPGYTYLTIGQDLFSVDEYLREQYNASLHAYAAKNTHNISRYITIYWSMLMFRPGRGMNERGRQLAAHCCAVAGGSAIHLQLFRSVFFS
jgi:hypothetical protein